MPSPPHPGRMLPNSCTTMKSCGRSPPPPGRWPSHSFLQPIHGFYYLILLTLYRKLHPGPWLKLNLSKKSYFPDIRQLGLEANVKSIFATSGLFHSSELLPGALSGSQSNPHRRGNWAIPRGHQCLEGAAPIPAVKSHSYFSLNVTLFSNIQNSIHAIPRLPLMKTNWAPIL